LEATRNEDLVLIKEGRRIRRNLEDCFLVSLNIRDLIGFVVVFVISDPDLFGKVLHCEK
jgi:hypothetical protein